jgi:peroxiredoxin
MRHAVIVLLTVCCFTPFCSRSSALLFAQTADELVAKNIQARGGM